MKLCKIFQVLASSVAIADRAGEIVRSVFSGGQLGIVEKTGADDLQTQADRSAQVRDRISQFLDGYQILRLSQFRAKIR